MTTRLAIAAAVSMLLVAGCAAAAPSISPSPVPSVVPAVSPTPAPTPGPTIAATESFAPGCVLPVTVADLAGWPGSPLIDHILSCFGNRDFVVTGYLAPPWGIGGLANGVVPSWLGEWGGLEVVLWQKPRPADGCVTDSDCVWMFLHASNPATVPLAPERWVQLTGHFDDPLASTCRAAGTGPDAVTTDALAVATCRGHFVVTEIRTVAAPST